MAMGVEMDQKLGEKVVYGWDSHHNTEGSSDVRISQTQV